MHLNLLHLDDALAGQSDFLGGCSTLGAHHIDARADGPEIRLWGRTGAMQKLQRHLGDQLTGLSSDQTMVTWLGSGDFHHVTALLVSLLVQARQTPVTIVHFDNHPDWVTFGSGIHCGSWVSYILGTGAVERVVSLGMTSADLSLPELKGADLGRLASKRLVMFPLDPPSTYVAGRYGSGPAHASRGHRIMWDLFSDEPNDDRLEAVLKSIETQAIYITIDKDALAVADAKTNWDQGVLSLDGLLAWLRALIARHKVLGVDIVGDYSQPLYGGSRLDQFWKKGEALLDQPWTSRLDKAQGRVNEATNLKLLAALEAGLC